MVEANHQTFPDITWVSDKKVAGGCSRRRPDDMVDMGSHVIIIDVDENQHKAYDCSCENARMVEILEDVGDRPTVFIRFNPDDYIDITGAKVTSCWRVSAKDGINRIMDKKKQEWKDRIQALHEQIRYWSTHPPQQLLTIVQLYYDGCDPANPATQTALTIPDAITHV